jgi:hypothetical protein
LPTSQICVSGATNTIGRKQVRARRFARAIVASAQSRDSPGKYILERKVDNDTTLLRWQGTIESHEFESLELLVDDADGKLIERTIAYRPFPALRIFREKMKALAGSAVPANAWDY